MNRNESGLPWPCGGRFPFRTDSGHGARMSIDKPPLFAPDQIMEFLILLRAHPDYARRYFPEFTLDEKLKLGDTLVRLQGELMQCRRRTPGAAADAVREMFAQLYDDFAEVLLPKFNKLWDFR